ncbi:MAG: hypothetical protein V1875_07375 [Candidatus Altiarchaeota archaeon]
MSKPAERRERMRGEPPRNLPDTAELGALFPGLLMEGGISGSLMPRPKGLRRRAL